MVAALLVLGLTATLGMAARWRPFAARRVEAEILAQARLLDTSHDAVFIWKLGGGIVYWNRAAEELYGWTAAEAHGKNPHELLRTEGQAPMDVVDDALARRGHWEGELAQTARSGRKVDVEGRFVVVRRGKGFAYVLETNRDVAERRRSEAERDALLESERAARSLADRAARLKDEFVAVLSHELRTPLTAILGWSTMLKRGTLDATAAARALDVIERNARAQAQLVDDLLDMSRILSGMLRLDVGDVDLAAVVENAVASLAPAAADKGVRLDRTIDAGAGAVRGDAGRLAQVVGNLISNAIKFTPKGGRVEVVLRRAGSRAEIVVRDTGKGIAPAFLPLVFDRFRQADGSITRSHGGLGIGLAIVKHLVELHGGTILAESEGEGRGAAFTVSLPIAAVRPEEREGPTPIEACESLAGLKILVVDDEEDARELVTRILAVCGAEVVAAGSAGEAIEAIQAREIDVLVSDIGMPEVDGYQLIHAVRMLGGKRGTTPALALTAFSRPEDRWRALRAGYQVHVSKPVDQGELVLLVARIAGRLPV
jgi:PAS domain S-box-containing protein